MRSSLKFNIGFLSFLMVVITYITTIVLSEKKIIDGSNLLDISNFIFLLVLFLIALIYTSIIAKSIIFPIKKIEKSMRNVAAGKILETKHLKNYSNITEITDFIDAYSDMMQIIRKNNFDLNSQQSKTEIILEHMADGVVAFSVSKQVVHMNKSSMRLLNISNLDDTFDKIVTRLRMNIDFDKVMYLPNYKSIEERITVGDNVLNLVFVPFYSERLIPMGVIVVVRNVTENVKLDNIRKEFVANVSHELKTPLTSIKGYSETIISGDLTSDEIVKFSKVINQEANRMDRLVTDLLQLSRFDYKKVSWKKMMFSLDELALNICEKMKYSASQKNHTLECVITVSPPKVYADRDAIEQVIVNILSNSIKYTPNDGIIKLFVGSVNNNAYVKVVDNGIGIPSKDLQRIFERFYRVDKARSREMGGTGLGLAIVKEIIDGNNGTVEIKSEVNQGTEVVITLPTKMEVKM
ncbi:MAG: cell wall metabolism sensor histidine kinase WalK [Clostridia bacterium]|nr:cell wall metabolism sensor histidine kinase WalK [Clostridia bacterium]